MSKDQVVNIFTSLVLGNDVAVPVAAMNALVLSIKESKATTWMELEDELYTAIASLKRCRHEDLGGRTNLSLSSGCDLFMKYVTRAFSLDSVEFDFCKEELLRRGEKFAKLSMSSRTTIAEIGHSFVQDSCTVLIHGHSRVVTALILKAAQSKQFNILVTEGRPSGDGFEAAKQFADAGIPTTVILDCAVGSMMDRVDLCIVGAEGVMENGGIVNKMGTYQIAMVAKALNKPFYVAVESYKFARMYPLTQRDIMDMCEQAHTPQDLSMSSDDQAHTTPTKQKDGIGKPVGGETGILTRTFTLTPPPISKVGGGGASGSMAGGGSVTSIGESAGRGVHCEEVKASSVSFSPTTIDFTPADFITLLFTDLGVLTPAAVSDELIKLYQ